MTPHLFLPVTLILLWLQLWWSLIPTWRDGEYYAYGWFVPVLALGFAWRRWQMMGEPSEVAGTDGAKRLGWRWGMLLIAAVLLILPLRMVSEADPGWRPPILAHAAIVFGLTHLLLWRTVSRKLSLWLLPVTVFALTAVPLPWQIEQSLVRGLTGTVIDLTRETFLLLGRPVEVMGERLSMAGEVVEVTEGCSGIRSLQSLGMAALFFGELLLLGWGRRLLLLGVAAACAVVVNTTRAWWLAEIHFSQGMAAADAAHDGIGHAAFAVSAGVLFGSACLLQRSRRGRRVVVVRRLQSAAAETSGPTP